MSIRFSISFGRTIEVIAAALLLLTGSLKLIASCSSSPIMRLNDPIFDILELLSDDKVKEWEAVYNDSTDAYYEEEDDE